MGFDILTFGHFMIDATGLAGRLGRQTSPSDLAGRLGWQTWPVRLVKIKDGLKIENQHCFI
jgi:hypothetical protein